MASLVALPQLWVPKAWGQTATFDFYISTTGNDTNAGTLAAPWALTSLQTTSANYTKMAGRRIGLVAGSYSLARLAQQSNNFAYNILTLPSGISATSPTYIASCDTNGNYSARAATITGTGGTCPNGMMGNTQSDTSKYITIDGIRFNGNFTQSPGLTGGGHILQFYSETYSRSSSLPATIVGIVVQNCELYNVEGNYSGGNYGTIILAGCVNAVIQNNLVHDVVLGPNDDASHSAGLLEIGCSATQYLYNTIYNCPSGIWVKEGSTGTIAAYNYIYNCANSGSEIAGFCSAFCGWDGQAGDPNPGPSPTTQVIHHNVIDGCGAVHKPVLNSPVSTAIAIAAYNNTVYETYAGSNNGWLHTAQGCSNKFYNNIYVATATTGGGGGQPGKLNLSSGQFTDVDYNCYIATNGNYSNFWGLSNGAAYTTLSAWRTATSSEAHSINVNPQFMLPGGHVAGGGANQFQLASGSPCTGTGQGGVNMGAWDGTTTQIGCSFATGSTKSTNAVPDAPTLSVS